MSDPRYRSHNKDDGPMYMDRALDGVQRGVVPKYAFDAIDPKAEPYCKCGRLAHGPGANKLPNH